MKFTGGGPHASRTMMLAELVAVLAQVDSAGASLEEWLRNSFFEQHCKRFHHRPFLAGDLPGGEKGVGNAPDGNRWNDCHYSNAFKRSKRTG